MRATGFRKLDHLLHSRKEVHSCLIRGESDSGKSTLCLRFLGEGLRAGENVALVTSRSPGSVVEQSRVMGCDMESYLRSGHALIFEYPETIEQEVATLEDHSRMVEEFRGLIGERTVSRLVFDPVNPLAAVNGRLDPQRCRAVLRAFSTLGASTLFVVEGAVPESFADEVGGAIVLTAPHGQQPGEMTVEGAGGELGAMPIRFTIQPGAGLVEAQDLGPRLLSPWDEPLESEIPAAEELRYAEPIEEPQFPEEAFSGETLRMLSAVESNEPPPVEQPVRPLPAHIAGTVQAAETGPRVLVIEPDATRRLTLRSHLEKNFAVLEAAGVNDAMTLVTIGRPDAILVAMEMPGASGVEVARMLREKGDNTLLIGLGETFRRVPEQIGALAAGIDICFSYASDPRVLRLTLLNLLQRLGVVRRGQARVEAVRMVRPPEPDAYSCTTDLGAFCGRIARETLYARENAIPFVILTFRLPDMPAAVEELAAFTAMQMRSHDSVYAGSHGVACLLTESDSPQMFLHRFWTQWKGGFSPVVEEMRFLNQDAFLQRAREFVLTRVGTRGAVRKPAGMAAAAGMGAGQAAGRGRVALASGSRYSSVRAWEEGALTK